MQTKGIVFLIPLMLSFFIGSLVLGFGLHKQLLISKFPKYTFILAFITGLMGAVIVNKVLGYGRPILILTVLALWAFGQLLIGFEIICKSKTIQETAK